MKPVGSDGSSTITQTVPVCITPNFPAAHVSYEHKNWMLGLRVNNLLDEEYSEIGFKFPSFPSPEPAFYPSPERNFWLSAKVNF